MNSFERKQLNRKQTSLEGWKTKAKARRMELRKSKLKNRDLTQSRDRWKAELKKEKNNIKQLQDEINRKDEIASRTQAEISQLVEEIRDLKKKIS